MDAVALDENLKKMLEQRLANAKTEEEKARLTAQIAVWEKRIAAAKSQAQ